MSLLISLLVAVILFGLALYIIQMIPLAEPFNNVARVLAIVIFVLYLVSILGAMPLHFYR